MLETELTISNFRCFSDAPARFAIKPGLQAFVGINNSGKSCLLRLFYEIRHVFQALNNPSNVQGVLMGGGQMGYSLPPSVTDSQEIFCNLNARDITLSFDIAPSTPDAILTATRIELVLLRDRQQFRGTMYVEGTRVAGPAFGVRADSANNLYIYRGSSTNPTVSLNSVAALFAMLSRTLYLGPFRNAVNIGGSGDYYDIQIGQPFITKWRALKTGYSKKDSEATYRLTDDIKRIFGFESLDINSSDDGQNLQLMVDGRIYKQTEIGSGLVQFILALANAAIRMPSFILIDEPELNLHPSLQVDFLTTLASYAEHGVLFATHNLGLARAVSNRVYSVRRVGKYDRDVRDFTGTKALAEFLGELGFNAYQDLGFETVLLVEGPTEVTTIQQLLRFYNKEHKIVLLPLGGASMINAGSEPQLAEITRISRKVYALIDSERGQTGAQLEADRQAFAAVCSKLNVPCSVLERRAIENYFPERAIRNVKGDKYRALAPFESLKAVNPAWGKAENWRIAREMTKSDLDGTDLGAFLEKLS